MTLLKLDVLSVRNIHSASISPSPAINFITGANASGKSSLLEAIFILGRSRSFRTTHTKQAIAFEQSQLTVSAQNRQQSGSVSTLGIQIDNKQCQIRIDQEDRQKADLAYALPVQLIHPKSYRLLDSGPQIRREFLDWGIFNQHKNFLPCWRKFNKALQQRNALLKTRQIKQLSAWDKELVEYGQVINDFRLAYLANLQPVFLEMASHFLNKEDVDLRFLPGWDDRQALDVILKNDLERDIRYGFTHSGPHRADFQTYQDKRLAKDYLSRGQQKLLVLALMLAQVTLLNQESPYSCCILIDDLASELDTENRAKLIKYLIGLSCQVFISSTDIADFGDLSSVENYKWFHVEQGDVKQL
ncbi:DNA replication/repair protein RecF [Methylomonas sp. MK1]|uniref:DNA replication/repair protein RecF n=1 Tax=Methylomonas sp. MK1 TaxID=1131552 RepID=UPI0003807FE4|nr:DNA replication/repair protein RecF [Methylomonas sp. MK1]